jgi:hypothetical protein
LPRHGRLGSRIGTKQTLDNQAQSESMEQWQRSGQQRNLLKNFPKTGRFC